MAKVWRRRSDEEPDRPPFVMLRGAKRSRSTQAQRLSENREPGSRDFARDDESLAARDDESYRVRDDEVSERQRRSPRTEAGPTGA